MNSRYISLFVFLLMGFVSAKAQDSAQVANTLAELLSVCKNVDFGDPKVQELGLFYKAAPYIVYRGEDKERKWKTAANYSDAKDKEQVNAICYRINGTVNQDSAYKIVQYLTQEESEGKWHVLVIHYLKKEKEKKIIFAFLKAGDRFLLGDID